MGGKPKTKVVQIKLDGSVVDAKKCAGCNLILPLMEFSIDKRRSCGRKSRCKKCVREHYHKNRDELLARRRVLTDLRRDEIREYNRKWYWENREHRIKSRLRWKKENPEKYRLHDQNRAARKKSLPDTLTPEQTRLILEKFDNSCALTGDKDYHLDHFIALSTGFGGTIYENIIPLKASLNISKKDANPFEWIKTKVGEVDMSRFKEVVEYLAEINGMSLGEYEEYVYRCYESKEKTA